MIVVAFLHVGDEMIPIGYSDNLEISRDVVKKIFGWNKYSHGELKLRKIEPSVLVDDVDDHGIEQNPEKKLFGLTFMYDLSNEGAKTTRMGMIFSRSKKELFPEFILPGIRSSKHYISYDVTEIPYLTEKVDAV